MSREGRKRWGFNERFVIGKQDNPMMERWRILQTPWFGIYVHFIYREDLDPVLHDHPWTFIRMVLRGGYVENYSFDPAHEWGYPQILRPFRPHRFPTTHAHRIVMVKPGTVSLVLVGRKQRVWGFWDPTDEIPADTGTLMAAAMGASVHIPEVARWVDYRDALGLRPTEGVTG